MDASAYRDYVVPMNWFDKSAVSRPALPDGGAYEYLSVMLRHEGLKDAAMAKKKMDRLAPVYRNRRISGLIHSKKHRKKKAYE